MSENKLLKLLHVIEEPDNVYAVAFSPDGRLLAVGGYFGLKVYSLEGVTKPRLKPLFEINRDKIGSVCGIAWSGDGRYMAVAGSRLALVDVEEGQTKTISTEPFDSLAWHGGHIMAAEYYPAKIVVYRFEGSRVKETAYLDESKLERLVSLKDISINKVFVGNNLLLAVGRGQGEERGFILVSDLTLRDTKVYLVDAKYAESAIISLDGEYLIIGTRDPYKLLVYRLEGSELEGPISGVETPGIPGHMEWVTPSYLAVATYLSDYIVVYEFGGGRLKEIEREKLPDASADQCVSTYGGLIAVATRLEKKVLLFSFLPVEEQVRLFNEVWRGFVECRVGLDELVGFVRERGRFLPCSAYRVIDDDFIAAGVLEEVRRVSALVNRGLFAEAKERLVRVSEGVGLLLRVVEACGYRLSRSRAMLERVNGLIGDVERLEARWKALKLIDYADRLLHDALEKARVFTGGR